MRISIRWIGVWLSLFGVSSVPNTAPAAKMALAIMDPTTGQILDGVRYDAQVYPASLTKMMTLFLLFEDLNRGRISLQTLFRVSKVASTQPPSKLGISPGVPIKVKDCILALALKSANDVAMVVAENSAKTSAQFVQRMNTKARELGLRSTVFKNPSGLHHPQQVTTPRDMALLIRAIWQKFPKYAAFMGLTSAKIGRRSIRTTNKLLPKVRGMQMGKTGYTRPAGFNLATLTNRRGHSVIVVAMGNSTARARDKSLAEITEMYYQAPYLLSSLLELSPSTGVASYTPISSKAFKTSRSSRSSLRIASKNRLVPPLLKPCLPSETSLVSYKRKRKIPGKKPIFTTSKRRIG